MKSVTYNRFYYVKIVKVDEDQHELRVHYIGWNQRYNEVISMSSVSIIGAQWETEAASVEKDESGCEEPLNANIAFCGSGMDGVIRWQFRMGIWWK